MGISGFIAVGVGAAMGAWLRWGLGVLMNPIFPAVPLGTLVANLSGGYLMGVALGMLTHISSIPVEMRLLVMTGFLGSLTTFSTFSAEAVTLFSRQQYGMAALHVSTHLLGSLAMTALGIVSVNVIRSA